MQRETLDFAKVCIAIANKAADPDGFVPIRRLVEAFGAELEARPLLCEGVIAAPKAPDARWRVLVDSDRSGFDAQVFETEESKKPLPVRVRFTIAHELAHMLRFRAKELGVELQPLKGSEKTKEAELKLLEDETDSLSPLLLVPENALRAEIEAAVNTLSLSQLCAARKRWAVSRETLLSRLNFLRAIDQTGIQHFSRLRRVGIGLGVWDNASTFAFPAWPTPFLNFDNNLAPEFLLGHPGVRLNRLQASIVDTEFCLTGGTALETRATVFVGTEGNPQSDKLPVQISVEGVKRRKDAKFLFLVFQT